MFRLLEHELSRKACVSVQGKTRIGNRGGVEPAERGRLRPISTSASFFFFRLRPILTSANFDFGQFLDGKFLDHKGWGPEGWRPKPGKGGALKGGRPKISRFFSPLPPQFSIFSPSLVGLAAGVSHDNQRARSVFGLVGRQTPFPKFHERTNKRGRNN